MSQYRLHINPPHSSQFSIPSISLPERIISNGYYDIRRDWDWGRRGWGEMALKCAVDKWPRRGSNWPKWSLLTPTPLSLPHQSVLNSHHFTIILMVSIPLLVWLLDVGIEDRCGDGDCGKFKRFHLFPTTSQFNDERPIPTYQHCIDTWCVVNETGCVDSVWTFLSQWLCIKGYNGRVGDPNFEMVLVRGGITNIRG